MTVFDNFRGYAFVHHRALNSVQQLTRAKSYVQDFDTVEQVLEGDVCWDFSGGSTEFYFRHPIAFIDTLSTSAIARKKSNGTLVTLDELRRFSDTNAKLVLELKVGRGNWQHAISALVAFLESYFPDRYWIDSYSIDYLRWIKREFPKTPVSLHTEFLWAGRVLLSAPTWPPLAFSTLDTLDIVDGIAIRYHGSAQYMQAACRDVLAAGKHLIVSRLHTLEQFRHSKEWGAAAGYMHCDFATLVSYNARLARASAGFT